MKTDMKFHHCNSQSEKGFSFFELVMVLFIAGMIIGPAYSIIFNTLGLGANEDRMETIRVALAEHYRVFGRFPRPADITAAQGDADYASEAALASFAPVAGVAGGNVLIGALPIQQLREAMGCVSIEDMEDAGTPLWQLNVLRNRMYEFRDKIFRDPLKYVKNADNIVDVEYRNTQADMVNCITSHHLLDDYGNKFLYAVSENATNLATFDFTDPNGSGPLDGAQISVINDGNVAVSSAPQWYVVLSHGPDGKGARDENGNVGPAACATGRDTENCDNDAVFRTMPPQLAAGNTYFDDRVDYSLAGSLRENDFWKWRDSGDPNMPAISFNDRSRLIISNKESVVYATTDRLVLGEGSMKVEDDGGNGGTLKATNNVSATLNAEATNDNIIGGNEFYSTKYCYSSPC